jgi:hypothetical protein
MEYVGPGAPFSSRFSLGPDNTGLAGTVRFWLLDNDGTADDALIGPVTAGIIEDPTGSGDYVYPDSIGVAPAFQGHFARAWDTGPGTRLFYDDDLLVTRTAVNPFTPVGNEYITMEELKIWLELEGDLSDNLETDLAMACEAASRTIDGYMHKQFYTTERTRYYTAAYGATGIKIHDLAELTSLSLDFDGSGAFATEWTNGSEFLLNPEGAVDGGYPFNSIDLTRIGRRFPRYQRGIRVEGQFGWADTPVNVRQAAKIIAAKLFKRRETPYAILALVASETVAAARIGRIDPDAAELLATLPGVERSGLQSVRLG